MLTKAHSYFLNPTGGLKLSHSSPHYKQVGLFSARANKWDLTCMRTRGSREQGAGRFPQSQEKDNHSAQAAIERKSPGVMTNTNTLFFFLMETHRVGRKTSPVWVR